MLSVEECVELGLYDPAAPDAALTWELLEFLTSVGATMQDLVEYREGLAGLAAVLVLRGGRGLTMAEAAAESRLDETVMRQLGRAAGFADPGSQDRVLTREFPALATAYTAASALFGEPATLALVRVMGASMARVADAVVSSFLMNVESGARGSDSVGLAVARANADAAALMTLVAPSLDTLLRQHLLAARRTFIAEDDVTPYEVQQLTVGFLDLADSTVLSREQSVADFGALLSRFETTVVDGVTAVGGRVVKLIGDEVLFAIKDPRAASLLALKLVRDLRAEQGMPLVRGGLAHGAVVLRDGDVFGPVVALAARIVHLVEPGRVGAPASLVRQAGVEHELMGLHEVRGFEIPLELCVLSPNEPAAPA